MIAPLADLAAIANREHAARYGSIPGTPLPVSSRNATKRLAGPCELCGGPVYRRPGCLDGRMCDTSRGLLYVPWRLFCSSRCRAVVRYREQREANPREPIACAICGERVDTRRADTRYCSGACRERAYRARRAAAA